MRTSDWLAIEQIPRFKDPMTALLWGSRIYWVHAMSGEPAPPALSLLFSHVLSADAEPAIVDALEFMLYHSTVPLRVHQLSCECVSPHEQAIADSIRAIQAGSLTAYGAAMEPVLVAEDALAIGPSMQVIATELLHVERRGFSQSANVVAPRAFLRAGVRNSQSLLCK